MAVAGEYRLIYVVWNTFFNLLTQEEQVRCFQNVWQSISLPMVVFDQAYEPAFLVRLQNNQYVEAESVEMDEVWLDVLRHDGATQVIEESHVSLSAAGVRLNPVVQRYTWPSELDLMRTPRRAASSQSLGQLEPRTVCRKSPRFTCRCMGGSGAASTYASSEGPNPPAKPQRRQGGARKTGFAALLCALWGLFNLSFLCGLAAWAAWREIFCTLRSANWCYSH